MTSAKPNLRDKLIQWKWKQSLMCPHKINTKVSSHPGFYEDIGFAVDLEAYE